VFLAERANEPGK
jgi:serum/glucocorticoid-regulated kinase 2